MEKYLVPTKDSNAPDLLVLDMSLSLSWHSNVESLSKIARCHLSSTLAQWCYTMVTVMAQLLLHPASLGCVITLPPHHGELSGKTFP